MSLLDRNPHIVELQARKTVRNERGERVMVADGPRIPIRCAVQPVREWSTSEENMTNGIQVLDLRRVFAREWPGDVHALMYFEGGEYEMVGAPQHNKMSPRTTHWAVTVRYVGEEPA